MMMEGIQKGVEGVKDRIYQRSTLKVFKKKWKNYMDRVTKYKTVYAANGAALKMDKLSKGMLVIISIKV